MSFFSYTCSLLATSPLLRLDSNPTKSHFSPTLSHSSGPLDRQAQSSMASFQAASNFSLRLSRPPYPLRPWGQALNRNKAWRESLPITDPDLPSQNAAGQHPGILWIGCSDSRVPETTITGSRPGDIFVHRNIANILHPGDGNATSVITYAVNVLRVKDIVVCGHVLCGGVHTALGNKVAGGALDSWLLPLRALREQLASKPGWSGLTDEEKERKLVEENVLAGVQTLLRNADVIRAMEADLLQPPFPPQELSLQVHGAVYDIEKGSIYEITEPESDAERANRLAAFKIS